MVSIPPVNIRTLPDEMAYTSKLTNIFVVPVPNPLEQMKFAIFGLVFHNGTITSCHLHISRLPFPRVSILGIAYPTIVVAKYLTTRRMK